MDTWLAGLTGGFVGTVVMTAFMMLMMKGQPSGPAMLLARFTGKDPMDKSLQMPAMLMHFVYGTFWGVVLGLAVDVLEWPTEWLWAYGLGLGVFLMIVMLVVWAPVIKMKPPEGEAAKMMTGMLFVHLVYGVVTGGVAQLMV